MCLSHVDALQETSERVAGVTAEMVASEQLQTLIHVIDDQFTVSETRWSPVDMLSTEIRQDAKHQVGRLHPSLLEHRGARPSRGSESLLWMQCRRWTTGATCMRAVHRLRDV